MPREILCRGNAVKRDLPLSSSVVADPAHWAWSVAWPEPDIPVILLDESVLGGYA